MATSNSVDSPFFEISAACEPVEPKTEHEISRLTSAEVSTRPQIPSSQETNLNNGAHENGLPRMKDLGKPDASLTHPDDSNPKRLQRTKLPLKGYYHSAKGMPNIARAIGITYS